MRGCGLRSPRLLLAFTCPLPLQGLWQQSWRGRTLGNGSQDGGAEKPYIEIGRSLRKPSREELRRAEEQRRAAAAREQEMDAEFERWWPTLGPAEKPQGRHLHYKVKGRAGMTDRMFTFSLLMSLGEYHNATVHVLGMSNPAWLLSPAHSPGAISETWDHYFNTSANGDMFWHEIVNYTDCKRVQDARVDLRTIFNDGSLCVDLVLNMYNFRYRNKWLHAGKRLKVSQEVLDAAQSAMARYGVPQVYGTCHIRRCDRLRENGLCTQVDAVRDALASYPEISTWLVFMYVEASYPDQLRQSLRPLKRRILYEDEMSLNTLSDGDNYFQYLVAQEIERRAAVQVETQLCHKRPTPYRVFVNPQLELFAHQDERSAFLEEPASTGGVCAKAASR